jgi:hypothetical protein
MISLTFQIMQINYSNEVSVYHLASQVARTTLKIHTANYIMIKTNILHGAVS